MTDIFLSYAREDLERIQPIVDALKEQGWAVFWDRRIPAGQTWRSYIGKALEDACCLIVVWSKDSVNSSWVIEEADEGKRRGILVPLLLDIVEQPRGFREIQAANLTDWQPGIPSIQFKHFIEDVHAILGAPEGLPKGDEERRIEDDITPKIKLVPIAPRLLARFSTYGVAAIAVVLLLTLSYWGYNKFTSEKSTVVVYHAGGPYHLGDQDIKGWPLKHGLCFEANFQLNMPIKKLKLRLKTFGVENSSIFLNGNNVGSLPVHANKPGHKRPNYWSSECLIHLPINLINSPGTNKLKICTEPVSNPEFVGDKDDFQIKDITIVAEE